MIGDSERDVEAGLSAGCKESILVETNRGNVLLEEVDTILK
jgi:D-glycero-D-manno-heptose 1,7-bisphosphate phosphatase